MKTTYPTASITQAQAALPKLCREGRQTLITNRDKPVAVLLSIGDFESIMETMDILQDSRAMKTLRAARAGKLHYAPLDLDNDNFGL